MSATVIRPSASISPAVQDDSGAAPNARSIIVSSSSMVTTLFPSQSPAHDAEGCAAASTASVELYTRNDKTNKPNGNPQTRGAVVRLPILLPIPVSTALNIPS